MLIKIRDLIQELITKEQTIQRAEMRVLQEQIKPHFLYNSIGTISALALESGSEEVSSALETLGRFYRNFLSKGDREITLEKEVAIVRDYLSLQKLRYGDILEDEYDVDDEAGDCIVPKLILQPLVENSIYHGIRQKGEPGVIKISAHIVEGILHLSVYDTGVGMDYETAQEIMSGKKKYTAPVEKDYTAHEYLGEYVEADDVNEGYTVYTCKLCGDKYNTAIKPHKFEAKVTAPTCTEQGYTTYKCSKCDRVVIGDYTDVIPHSYSLKYVPANCTDDGYTINYCTVCGYEDETSKSVVEPAVGTAHVYESKTVQPTCTEDGFTAEVCTVCCFVYEESKTDIVPALGHDFEEEYTADEDYFRHHQCTRCDGESVDKTCYIDIGTETVSNPNYAAFKQSSTNTSGVNDKLDISTNEDGSIDFEITGSRSDFTIDINAVGRTEVKLNGVTLINDGRDCINVKNYEPLYDENGNPVTNEDGTPAYGEAPKVFISAKDGSENLLKVTTSGNGIDSRCPIELRGHGVLTIQSYGSTAIDNRAKIVIKNLTLDILSANRGIDTKDTVLVPGIGGVMVEDEVYFNIEIEDNANIKIKSADDCIRCKNMTVFELEEGHTATVMNLESTGGDGIQLEGNKGFSALSGEFTIKAKKYAFNCAENLIEIKPPAVVTVTGGTYAKPAE